MQRKYGRSVPASLPAHRMLSKASVGLPAAVDLRSSCGPIKDQQSLGSCTGHAFSSAIEWVFRKYLGKQPILSPLYFYSSELLFDGDYPQDAGSNGITGCNIAVTKGCCEDSLYPDSSLKIEKPTPAMDANAAEYRLGAYHGLSGSQTALSVLGDPTPWPITLGFTVYESFESQAVAQTGIMPIPAPDEQVLGGHEVLCLAADTRISLLSGQEVTIASLEGKTAWVYSVSSTTGEIVPGKAKNIRKTGHKTVVRVTLDDGNYFDCTPDHRIMLRDGSYLEAGSLRENQSLMPLYRRNDAHGYEEVYDPVCQHYVKTHRKIARSLYGDYGKGWVIHHQDFNKRNNEPTNLLKMTWEEHTALHSMYTQLLAKYAQSPEGREKSRETMQRNWDDPEWREKQLKLLHQYSLQRGQEAAEREIERLFEIASRHASEDFKAMKSRVAIANIQKYNKTPHVLTSRQIEARRENARALNAARWNHKVASVIPLPETVDVYDMEVEEHHNFALACGIFVHNCVGYDVGDVPTLRPADALPSVLVQNSWGEGWGLSGFVWMPVQILDSSDSDLKITHSGHPW